MNHPRAHSALAPFVCASLIAGLAGCAARDMRDMRDKPGASRPTATLVIDSNLPGLVQAFDDEACDPAIPGTRIGVLHPTAGDALRGSSKTIAAGRPLVLALDMRSELEGQPVACSVRGRFAPSADGVYHLFYRYSPSTRSCTLQLMHRSALGSIEPEASFALLPANCPGRPGG